LQKETKQVILSSKRTQEAAIWRDFKNGDEAAFIWIYSNYFDALYNYAHQFGLDTELIKDQIQELFIYLREHRKQLGDVKNIKYYLYRSLRRRLLKVGRRRFSFTSLFSQEGNSRFDIEYTYSQEVKMIEHLVSEETRIHLSKSIEKLTSRQKEVVLHFYYEGMSYQEIADIMNIRKVKSVRKLIYRAIDSLRKDLKDLKNRIYN
jgi:RNA polymerase sigma-70 factor (ECF subfamily)